MNATEIQLDYTATTDKTFDEAVASVEARAAEAGFRVLHVHDVAATLASKGFEREPYKIVEICQAGAAHEALQKDPMAGLMMPCKINVYRNQGKTVLSAIRPALLADFFPGKGLEALAQKIDGQITAIVEAAR